MRITLWLLGWAAIISAAEFAAFSISRPVGDIAFLLLSASIPVFATFASRPLNTWPARTLGALLGTALVYFAFACVSMWIRTDVLHLSESFGASLLNGAVWVVIPCLCLLLSLIISFAWWLFRRQR